MGSIAHLGEDDSKITTLLSELDSCGDEAEQCRSCRHLLKAICRYPKGRSSSRKLPSARCCCTIQLFVNAACILSSRLALTLTVPYAALKASSHQVGVWVRTLLALHVNPAHQHAPLQRPAINASLPAIRCLSASCLYV